MRNLVKYGIVICVTYISVISLILHSKTDIKKGQVSHAEQNISTENSHDINDISINELKEEMVSSSKTAPTLSTMGKDTDIWRMLENIRGQKTNFFPSNFESTTFRNLSLNLGAFIRNSTEYYLQDHSGMSNEEPNWLKFHRNIRRFSMYDPEDPAIDALLHDLSTSEIIEANEGHGGLQLKFFVKLKNNGSAIIKPMRFSKEGLYSGNGTKLFNISDLLYESVERHFAEIAAFHLDRILGFYRAPPVAGRWINLTQIFQLLPEKTAKTFYVKDMNICFTGTCKSLSCSPHFSTSYPVCGNKDILEVSATAFLPKGSLFMNGKPWTPHITTYRTNLTEPWEGHSHVFCKPLSNGRYRVIYSKRKHFIDLMDMHVYDFLMGNRDRHTFHVLNKFKNNATFPLHFDNGQGFGNPHYDEMLILVPIVECCNIRKSTFLKLVKLYTGRERLSDMMRRSLLDDPLTPVLTESQLEALDRRVGVILKVLSDCLKRKQIDDVIVDDGF